MRRGWGGGERTLHQQDLSNKKQKNRKREKKKKKKTCADYLVGEVKKK